ncbi:MAG: branched-chain amino acid ABC transporter permease [Ilumatobacteraceae bacterium]
MPDLKPYIALGLALGGVYSMSGVGLVVLYRATGVLNLAYGAVGAMGALISWSLINDAEINQWLAYAACILFGGVVTLAYGWLLGPPFASREPLVKATATIGFMLILLGAMQWYWDAALGRTMLLPTSTNNYEPLDGIRVSQTQLIGMAFPIIVTVVTAIYLRVTRVGTAMRALADDREATAMLGVPVRRVEAAAWFGCGLLAGFTGLLMSNLVSLDSVSLTFIVVPGLAAALISQLKSLWVTLAAGFVIGLVQSCLTGFNSLADYRTMTPFVLAFVALLWLGARGRTQERLS